MSSTLDVTIDNQPAPVLDGIVAELAGALKGSEIEDRREQYAEYLLQEYSGP